MPMVCFSLGSSASNVSVSRGSSEPAPQMIWGEGFTVDQFNIVIEAINVTENVTWNALLGCIYLRIPW